MASLSGDVTDPDKQTNEQTTRKHRATQLLICKALSCAIKLFGHSKAPKKKKIMTDFAHFPRPGENYPYGLCEALSYNCIMAFFGNL